MPSTNGDVDVPVLNIVGSKNWFQEAKKLTMNKLAMAGRSNGTITNRSIAGSLAPSRRAASSTSIGIRATNRDKIQVVKPSRKPV